MEGSHGRQSWKAVMEGSHGRQSWKAVMEKAVTDTQRM
jgi:hypothetical protein